MEHLPSKLDRTVLDKYRQFDFLLKLFFQKNQKNVRQVGNRYEGQGKLLMLLMMEPLMTQSELTKKSGMRAQSAAEMLGKLAQRGCIKRYPSETDRRSMMVELTSVGRQEYLANKQASSQPLVLDALTESEKVEFGRLLSKLVAGVDEMLGEEGKRYRHLFDHDFKAE